MFTEKLIRPKTNPVDTDAIAYIIRRNGFCTIYEDDVLTIKDLSLVDRMRYEWIEYFKEKKRDGCEVYHLTVTYNELADRALKKSEVIDVFEDFYKKYFLGLIVGNNYTRPRKNKMQPITVAFIDEHESLANKSIRHKFADRYHIHAVVAAHPDTVAKFESLLGENTLKSTDSIHCGLIKTTYLNHAAEFCAAYASKKKFHYDDFLIFGPKKLD